MLKITFADYLCLSPAISTQITFKICVTARNREKVTKTPHFRSARSFKVINVDTRKKLVSCACYAKPECQCLSGRDDREWLFMFPFPPIPIPNFVTNSHFHGIPTGLFPFPPIPISKQSLISIVAA